MLRARFFLVLLALAGPAVAVSDKPIVLGAEQARLLGVSTAPAVTARHVTYDQLIGEVQLPLAGSALSGVLHYLTIKARMPKRAHGAHGHDDHGHDAHGHHLQSGACFIWPNDAWL